MRLTYTRAMIRFSNCGGFSRMHCLLTFYPPIQIQLSSSTFSIEQTLRHRFFSVRSPMHLNRFKLNSFIYHFTNKTNKKSNSEQVCIDIKKSSSLKCFVFPFYNQIKNLMLICLAFSESFVFKFGYEAFSERRIKIGFMQILKTK